MKNLVLLSLMIMASSSYAGGSGRVQIQAARVALLNSINSFFQFGHEQIESIKFQKGSITHRNRKTLVHTSATVTPRDSLSRISYHCELETETREGVINGEYRGTVVSERLTLTNGDGEPVRCELTE